MSKRIKNPACLTYWTLSTVYYDKRSLLIRQPVALAKLDPYGPSIRFTEPSGFGYENRIFGGVGVDNR